MASPRRHFQFPENDDRANRDAEDKYRFDTYYPGNKPNPRRRLHHPSVV